MHCSILGLGTAVPENQNSQSDVLAMSERLVCEDERQQRLSRMLFRKSGVETRHGVVSVEAGDDWKSREDPLSPGMGPRTAERMEIYEEHALPLARQAAESALRDANVRADEITHLVTVSCTGFAAPGVDVGLIQALGLNPTTQRIHVGFMGCHGAINGLRAVQGLTGADPNAKVLMCAVELCCLHFRMAWDDDGIIGNALFADGAAALVAVGQNDERPEVWGLTGTGCCLIPDSTDAMGWNIGNYGFDMKLTAGVATAIETSLRPWIESWLASLQTSLDQVGSWAVHPGGPRIIDTVESVLDLPESNGRFSREILRTHGNMSSPTVLFVLNSMRKAAASGPTVLLGFGPGLMAEAALVTTSF